MVSGQLRPILIAIRLLAPVLLSSEQSASVWRSANTKWFVLATDHRSLTTGHWPEPLPQNKTGDGCPSPVRFYLCCLRGLLLRLRLFVQFHPVAGVHVFHGEHDHSRRRGGCGPDDDDLAYRASRQIFHVNHRTVALLPQAGIEGWRLFLRVVTDRRPERK